MKEDFCKKYTICQNFRRDNKMLFCNLGKYHDLIYILTEYFCAKNKIQSIDMSNVPESSRLFFYNNDTGTSFIQQIFWESYEELLRGGGIEIIQKRIINCSDTINKVAEFYFGKEKIRSTHDRSEFIKEVNKEIVKSKLPAEIKSSLYALFIDPYNTLKDVANMFFDLFLQITKMYESRISNVTMVQRNIMDTDLLQKLDMLYIAPEKISCSICLLDRKCIKVVPVGDRFLLFLGEEYGETLELCDENKLKDFGNILTEENRLKILNLMHSNNGTTIKDIEQQLGFSGTNAYYHLALMVKFGAVTTRNEGRAIFYNINKTYFKSICYQLSKYFEI